MHSILDSIFGSIFGRFLLPTSTPESQLNASRLAFSWFSAFKVDINFGSHFGTNLGPFLVSKKHSNPPKNRFQETSEKMIDFGMDFLVILAPFWHPSWDHVGHFSGQNGPTLWNSPLFFVALVFVSLSFRRFDPILAPFWLHLGASGPHLGSIWEVFGPILVPSWRYHRALGRKSWHWMSWWGYANRQEFLYFIGWADFLGNF